MNATTSVPARKATAKKTPSTPDTASAPIENEAPAVTIADICTWIASADQKLEDAYDAAERGEPIDVLLDHICHSVLTNPITLIHRDDLTQADAKRLYTDLFPVLACLQGAIKLAEGTILHHALGEAFDLLDAAQTALDSATSPVRLLPVGGHAHSFLRGKELALKMMAEFRERSSDTECYRKCRDPGKPQKNIFSDYLGEIEGDPWMDHGFASVLCTMLGCGEDMDLEFFDALTLADTEAGVPGEDGTLRDDYGGLAPAEPPAPATDAFASFGGFEKSLLMIGEVIAIIEGRSMELHSDLVFGAKYVTEYAQRILDEGFQARDADACEDASGPMAVAIRVIEAALIECDDLALHGALRLMEFTKSTLDDEIARHDTIARAA